jgi:RNA polymerase sigma factor (sigma-70 family)
MPGNFDKKFVNKCKRGDRKALEELYRQSSETLLGVCLRYTKNLQDAEDVFHEGFIKILNNLKNVKDESKIWSWMIRIMANTAINFLKKKQRLGENEFVDNENYDFRSDNEFEQNDDSLLLDIISEKELYELIGQLPDGYRIVLSLYAIEGFTHKEIAQTLGISESTSKTQYQKAKAKLKKLIEEKTKITVKSNKK